MPLSWFLVRRGAPSVPHSVVLALSPVCACHYNWQDGGISSEAYDEKIRDYEQSHEEIGGCGQSNSFSSCHFFLEFVSVSVADENQGSVFRKPGNANSRLKINRGFRLARWKCLY